MTLILESGAASTHTLTHVLDRSSKEHFDDTSHLAHQMLMRENAVKVGRRIHRRTPKRHETRSVPYPRFLSGGSAVGHVNESTRSTADPPVQRVRLTGPLGSTAAVLQPLSAMAMTMTTVAAIMGANFLMCCALLLAV